MFGFEMNVIFETKVEFLFDKTKNPPTPKWYKSPCEAIIVAPDPQKPPNHTSKPPQESSKSLY